MKYIYSSVLFMILLFITSNIVNFGFEQEVVNYDLNDNPIERIDIDVDKINVNISSTLDKDIRIEHIYSESNNPTSNLYSYQDGNQLIIKEYPYNSTNVAPKKETLNIYLPEEYDYKSMLISTENGKVSIDGVDVSRIVINSNAGDVDLANLKSDKLSINGGMFGINARVITTSVFDIDVDQTKLLMNNIISDEVNIDISALGEMEVERLISNVINIEAIDTKLDLELNESLNYEINTKKQLSTKKLEKIADGQYQYKVDTNDEAIIYNINQVEDVNVNFVVYEEQDE